MMGTFFDGDRFEQVDDRDLAHLEAVVASVLGERTSVLVTFVDERAEEPSSHRLRRTSPMRFHYADGVAAGPIDADRVAIMRIAATSRDGLMVQRGGPFG